MVRVHFAGFTGDALEPMSDTSAYLGDRRSELVPRPEKEREREGERLFVGLRLITIHNEKIFNQKTNT